MIIPVNLWTNEPVWSVQTLLEFVWMDWDKTQNCPVMTAPSLSRSEQGKFRKQVRCINVSAYLLGFPFNSLLKVYEIWWWTRDSSVGIVKNSWLSRKQRNVVPISSRDKGAHSLPKGPNQCNTLGIVLTPEVKQLTREAKHSPPSSAVVKNEWGCICTLPTPSWPAQWQIQCNCTRFGYKGVVTVRMNSIMCVPLSV